MLISTDNQLASTRKGAGKKFVVIRIIADLFQQRLRGIELPFVNCKIDERLQINRWELFCKSFPNPLVFFNYLPGNNQTQLAISPRLENPIWRPCKKDP
jgi:hypothetical protein